MKPQTTFVWSDCTVHLNPETSIDLNLTVIIDPWNPELDDPLRLNDTCSFLVFAGRLFVFICKFPTPKGDSNMPDKTPTPDDHSAILEKASPLNTNQILKLRDYADKLQTEEQQEDK